VFAPRDEYEGGTWVGFNDNAVLVTLSNLPVYRDEARSRGALVDELLRSRSVAEARRVLHNSYDQHTYEGFNAVVASPDDRFVGVNDGDLRVVEPDEVVCVVTNSPFDEPGEKARAVAGATPDPHGYETPVGWLDATRPVLASHDLGVCAHDKNRGTTSSNLMYVAPDADGSYWGFVAGAPCEASYTRVFPEPGKEL
jgi:hypothetical protein